MADADWKYVDVPDKRVRLQIVGTTVVASWLLLLVHTGIVDQWAYFDDTATRTVWLTQLIPLPLFIALLLDTKGGRFPWLAGLAYSLVLLLIAWHTGGALAPNASGSNFDIFSVYGFCVGAATFILPPFAQGWRKAGWPVPYEALYQTAWNNTLTLMVAAAFTGAFWLILLLWSGLFSLLDITFFKELFTDRLFVYPVTGLLVGGGIVIGRTQSGVVQAVLKTHLALGRALLPLVVVLALCFLAAVLVNSLEPLWKTGHATVLLNALIFAMVVLFNYVYQDGVAPTLYARPITLLTRAAIVTLPVFAGIALYALYLRTDQYGWTQMRLWATLFTLYATAYSVCYAVAALVPSAPVFRLVGVTNVWIAVGIAASLLLTQSPLIDFRTIAVNDQLRRTPDRSELDLAYLRFHAGRPGYDALLALKKEPEVAADTALVAKIDRYIEATNQYSVRQDLFADRQFVDVLPEDTEIPEGLLNAVEQSHGRYNEGACGENRRCLLARIPLGRDGGMAWVVHSPNWHGHLRVYATVDGAWKQVGVLNGKCCDGDVGEKLRQGEFRIEPSQWQDLYIGDKRYRFADH